MDELCFYVFFYYLHYIPDILYIASLITSLFVMNFLFPTNTNLFKDSRFIPLGKITQEASALDNTDSVVSQKINRAVNHEVEGIWGTLGWADDSPFTPTGKLYFSESGNYNEGLNQHGEEHVLTQQEIADLKAINPDLDTNKPGQVRERYINFNEIEFELPEAFNPIEEMPQLRLTLFLQPDEGAIVYYQHSERGNKNDPHAVFEYILHQGGEPTRDRLNYVFPVEPKHKLIAVNEEENKYTESTEETGIAFIIKVLTFKQKAGTDDEIFESQKKEVNKSNKLAKAIDSVISPGTVLYELVGEDKYDLLLFNKDNVENPDDGGAFERVTEKGQVNSNLKTLLLIHGTFVDTNSSFKDILKKDDLSGTSFLQRLLSDGKFEQIIALNHPTISHDARQNVEWLRNRMQELEIRIEQPLQIITTSRGALVAEYMASDPDTQHFIPEISKVIMFSAGNGCGYFQLGGKISAILSIWKKTASGPTGKIILTIAQLSIDWFLKQPGCVLMNEDKPVLSSILNKPPLNNNIEYMTVASDWHNCLNENLAWYTRLGNTSLDVMIKIALGKRHDWVIGYERQIVIPINSIHSKKEERHSVHGRYLEKGYVKDQDCVTISDPHLSIKTFFN